MTTSLFTPNRDYRISPALWEEPRCSWHAGGAGKKLTLQILKTYGTKWQFEKNPRSNYYKIKGEAGYLTGLGKLNVCNPGETPDEYYVKQVGAYFMISSKRSVNAWIECEDGYLGAGTDSQRYAFPFKDGPWSEWSQIPQKVFRILWKVDRADIDCNRWMSGVSDDKPLNELAICGTHDSCTWKFSSSNYSRTQDYSISRQLEMGVRFLDIRLDYDFKIYHAKDDTGVSLDDVLRDVKRFLNTNPRETVIMVIKREGKSNATDSLYAQRMRKVFDGTSTRVKNKVTWFTGNRVPKLGEVHGKVVLVRRYEDALAQAPGIDLTVWSKHDNDSFYKTVGGVQFRVQDEYSVTQNSTKKGFIENVLRDMTSPVQAKPRWYINFTSAAKLQKPSWYSDDINPWLGANLNFHTTLMGTLMLDHPSPAIVDRIIRFNFKP